MAKETRIVFRASDEMKGRLDAVAEQVGLSASQLAEACVEALIKHIEEHGEITLPLTVLPKRRALDLEQKAHELEKKPVQLSQEKTPADRAVRRRTA